MTRAQVGQVVVLAALVGLAGCGSGLHPVEGQVVWMDGQPATELAGSLVCFESAEHRTLSRAELQADARFQLSTMETSPDGAPPGLHRVYILEKMRFVGVAKDPLTAKGLPRQMALRFGKVDTAGLEVTVPPPEGPVVLKVERARQR